MAKQTKQEFVDHIKQIELNMLLQTGNDLTIFWWVTKEWSYRLKAEYPDHIEHYRN